MTGLGRPAIEAHGGYVGHEGTSPTGNETLHHTTELKRHPGIVRARRDCVLAFRNHVDRWLTPGATCAQWSGFIIGVRSEAIACLNWGTVVTDMPRDRLLLHLHGFRAAVMPCFQFPR